MVENTNELPWELWANQGDKYEVKVKENYWSIKSYLQNLLSFFIIVRLKYWLIIGNISTSPFIPVS